MNLTNILAISLLFISLNAQDISAQKTNTLMKKIQHNKAVASYVSKISASIAEQLLKNSDFKTLASMPVVILPIVNLYDKSKTSLATVKINENLIHEMFTRGFKIIANVKSTANCILFGTFTNYKDGMIINERIIDKKSSEVYSTAQVFISQSELKSINKIYHKYDWFSE